MSKVCKDFLRYCNVLGRYFNVCFNIRIYFNGIYVVDRCISKDTDVFECIYCIFHYICGVYMLYFDLFPLYLNVLI